MLKNHIGMFVKDERIRKNFSQQQLAKMLDLSAQTRYNGKVLSNEKFHFETL